MRPPCTTLCPYTTLFRSDLGQQRAARDEDAEVEAEERDIRDHRRTQHVAREHAALRQALGTRGAHVVLVLDVEQVRAQDAGRSEEHTSELQSLRHLVCRL